MTTGRSRAQLDREISRIYGNKNGKVRFTKKIVKNGGQTPLIVAAANAEGTDGESDMWLYGDVDGPPRPLPAIGSESSYSMTSSYVPGASQAGNAPAGGGTARERKEVQEEGGAERKRSHVAIQEQPSTSGRAVRGAYSETEGASMKGGREGGGVRTNNSSSSSSRAAKNRPSQFDMGTLSKRMNSPLRRKQVAPAQLAALAPPAEGGQPQGEAGAGPPPPGTWQYQAGGGPQVVAPEAPWIAQEGGDISSRRTPGSYSMEGEGGVRHVNKEADADTSAPADATGGSARRQPMGTVEGGGGRTGADSRSSSFRISTDAESRSGDRLGSRPGRRYGSAPEPSASAWVNGDSASAGGSLGRRLGTSSESSRRLGNSSGNPEREGGRSYTSENTSVNAAWDSSSSSPSRVSSPGRVRASVSYKEPAAPGAGVNRGAARDSSANSRELRVGDAEVSGGGVEEPPAAKWQGDGEAAERANAAAPPAAAATAAAASASASVAAALTAAAAAAAEGSTGSTERSTRSTETTQLPGSTVGSTQSTGRSTGSTKVWVRPGSAVGAAVAAARNNEFALARGAKDSAAVAGGEAAPGVPRKTMLVKTVSPLRAMAVARLMRVAEGGAYVDQLANDSNASWQREIEGCLGFRTVPPDATRIPQVTDMVAGATRWRRYLDYVLAAHYREDLASMEPLLLQILRLGLFEILKAGREPHGVVSQMVEIAKLAIRPGAGSFANAVFRNVLRSWEAGELPAPVVEGDERACARALATIYSHPVWLVRRWMTRFGEPEAIRFMEYNNMRPTYALRANLALGMTSAAVGAELSSIEVEYEESQHLDEFVRLHAGMPHAVRGQLLANGKCSVQDESAGLVVALLDPQPGEVIVDCCAAPGGKALYSAARMKGQGRLLAVDVNESRLRRVAEAAQLQGVADVITTHVADIRDFADGWGQKADKVLLDAPCSGLGVLAKRADLRWRRTLESLAELTDLQDSLLDSASRLVRPGGLMVYSTCTTEPDENGMRVEAFLARHPDFHVESAIESIPLQMVTPEGYMATLPHRDAMDGAFGCRLRRSLNV